MLILSRTARLSPPSSSSTLKPNVSCSTSTLALHPRIYPLHSSLRGSPSEEKTTSLKAVWRVAGDALAFLWKVGRQAHGRVNPARRFFCLCFCFCFGSDLPSFASIHALAVVASPLLPTLAANTRQDQPSRSPPTPYQSLVRPSCARPPAPLSPLLNLRLAAALPSLLHGHTHEHLLRHQPQNLPPWLRT